MKKLKLGVIGAGSIFRLAHAEGWIKHPEVEIAAICDPVEENARSLAELYQIPLVHTDYQSILHNPEIDMIDICTPNYLHSPIAISALEAGKHVFGEKPDAINAEEAQKMADAALGSGKILMTMRNNRFLAASQFLKQYTEQGLMGEIYTGRCGWIRRRGIPGKGSWFTNKALSGGGPLIDLGVHYIDLAIWIMGNPKPISVSGATYTKFADLDATKPGYTPGLGIYNVEDLAAGFIRFENGATLQIEFSWASNIEEDVNFLELRGTKSGSSLRSGELKLFTELAGTPCDIYPRLPIQSGSAAHESNIHHFVECVQQRETPIIHPEHGVDMIKILCAIYESAERREEIKL